MPAILPKLDQNQESYRAVETLVARLDSLRSETGSFVCRGRDEDEIVALALSALKAEYLRSMTNEIIAALERHPHADWVFRSSPTVLEEPRAMQSVFLPRDQARRGVFLPYVVYAITKLYFNFQRVEVQEELRADGHDPSSVGLAIIIQVVAGARDSTGAIGRERTASFAARIFRGDRRCECNLVFGLPMLATRPVWDNVFQAATVTARDFDARGLFDPNGTGTTIEWWSTQASAQSATIQDFRQTYKAILIPEKGIVYEPLKLDNSNLIEPIRVRATPGRVYLPIPLLCLKDLFGLFAMLIPRMADEGPPARYWRADGVIVKRPDAAQWERPQVVNFIPAFKT